MSTPFQIPEWLIQAAPPPPPPPPVDDHRIESLVNQFIAGKQDALFTAPDAFYRLQGADAVQGRPAIAQRLLDLRTETLDQTRNDSERAALDPRLDLHIDDAMDGIDRHVAEQRRVQQRQVVAQRQALILRAAELEHDNDDKIAGLAEANASAARELARMTGQPEEPAVQSARSAIWRTAIDQRIGSGKGPLALALFDQVKDQLAPADRLSLDTTVQAARADQAADQWIARQTATDGPPLQQRLDADADLPADTKAIVRAKVDASDSAEESTRAAKVQALDEEMRNAFRILATTRDLYEPGTFARLANTYAVFGDAQKAGEARRVALQEPFLLAFAQATPDRQQKLVDSLLAQDQAAAQAIQQDQYEANIQGYSGPRTALGSQPRSEGVNDDMETERLLDAVYAIDRRHHGSESADLDEAHVLFHQIHWGNNKHQGKAGEDAEVTRLKAIDPDAKIIRQIRVYVDGGPDYMVADIIFRGNGVAVINITEVKTGSAFLTDSQLKVLAQAARDGGVYITNVDAAEKLRIEPNKTLGAQRIIPDVYVTGGDTEKIMRQMRNQGIDVRPAGIRGRLRVLGPPPL